MERSTAAAVRVVAADEGPELPIVEGDGTVRALVWPGIGSRHRSMHHLSLGANASTVELRHPGEAVYYVLEGSGEAVDRRSGESHPLDAGSMVHMGPGDPYVIRAGGDGLELLGGPSPPDPALYDNAGEAPA